MRSILTLKFSLGAVLIAIVLLLDVVTAFADDAPAAALTVSTAVAVSTEHPLLLKTTGPVLAWDEASIASQEQGLPVLEVLVRVGDQVKKGQLLARFDDRSVTDELATALAQVDEDTAQFDQATNDAERVARLKEGYLSAQNILQVKAKALEAKAHLAGSRAQAESYKLKLEHARILAPDSGTISSRTVTLGAVPMTGVELFRIIRQNRLEWHPQISAESMRDVRPGMMVTVEFGEAKVSGKIRELAPMVDPATQLGVVYADLNPSDILRSGVYAKGSIELGHRSVIVVPSQSITTHDGRTFVVSLKGKQAHLLPVKLGAQENGTSEVLSGVAAGTVVITQGAGFLTEGSYVQVAPAASFAH